MLWAFDAGVFLCPSWLDCDRDPHTASTSFSHYFFEDFWRAEKAQHSRKNQRITDPSKAVFKHVQAPAQHRLMRWDRARPAWYQRNFFTSSGLFHAHRFHCRKFSHKISVPGSTEVSDLFNLSYISYMFPCRCCATCRRAQCRNFDIDMFD